jgi:hypothetical protein
MMVRRGRPSGREASALLMVLEPVDHATEAGAESVTILERLSVDANPTVECRSFIFE